MLECLFVPQVGGSWHQGGVSLHPSALHPARGRNDPPGLLPAAAAGREHGQGSQAGTEAGNRAGVTGRDHGQGTWAGMAGRGCRQGQQLQGCRAGLRAKAAGRDPGQGLQARATGRVCGQRVREIGRAHV